MKILRGRILVGVLFAMCLIAPSPAYADPRQDAQAVFNEFLAAMTAADAERIIGLAPLSALVLSDSVVLLSGLWHFQRSGDPAPAELRISLVVVKRADRWLIAQFHNSPRPIPR